MCRSPDKYPVPLLATLMVLAVTLLGGCRKEGSRSQILPSVQGDPRQVMVVTGSSQWDSAAGKALRSTLTTPVKMLPQDEPTFLPRHLSLNEFKGLIKRCHNLVFLVTYQDLHADQGLLAPYFNRDPLRRLRDNPDLWMAVRKNAFAHGQTVLYLFSQSPQTLADKLLENQQRILEVFLEAENRRILRKISRQPQEDLMKFLERKYSLSVLIPQEWHLAKHEDNFVWFRHRESDEDLNLFVHVGELDKYLDVADPGAYRDSITHKYLNDGGEKQLFITRQKSPDFRSLDIENAYFNDRQALNLRGLWKVSDNSSGGPFVGYLFKNEELGKVYYLEGYVCAPGSEKRKHIRKLEVLLSTFRFTKIPA